MKKDTNTETDKKRRPDPECQRDDLRNQSFYHVGVEYYPKPAEKKTSPKPTAKTKRTRKRS